MSPFTDFRAWYSHGFPRVSGDEPWARRCQEQHAQCFPRVSGDEPQHLTNIRDDLAFSPRERG